MKHVYFSLRGSKKAQEILARFFKSCEDAFIESRSNETETNQLIIAHLKNLVALETFAFCWITFQKNQRRASRQSPFCYLCVESYSWAFFIEKKPFAIAPFVVACLKIPFLVIFLFIVFFSHFLPQEAFVAERYQTETHSRSWHNQTKNSHWKFSDIASHQQETLFNGTKSLWILCNNKCTKHFCFPFFCHKLNFLLILKAPWKWLHVNSLFSSVEIKLFKLCLVWIIEISNEFG